VYAAAGALPAGHLDGDFQEALAALLGKDAPNLSPAVISRLTAEWKNEYDRWQKRDLSARRYVNVWGLILNYESGGQEFESPRARQLTD